MDSVCRQRQTAGSEKKSEIFSFLNYSIMSSIPPPPRQKTDLFYTIRHDQFTVFNFWQGLPK